MDVITRHVSPRVRRPSVWGAAKKRLEAAGLSGPVIDARLLVEAAAEATRLDIVTDPYRALTPDQEATLEDYLTRRERREPVSHILGRKGFWKIMLQVTPDVLTPRPDTECVVDAALKAIPEFERFSMLDLGVGSGAIILAILAERPNGKGLGIDVSEEALAVARDNAAHLGLGAQSDLAGQRFQVAVAVLVLSGDALLVEAVDLAGGPGQGRAGRQGDAAHVEPGPGLQARAGAGRRRLGHMDDRGQAGDALHVIDVVARHADDAVDEDAGRRAPAGVKVQAECLHLERQRRAFDLADARRARHAEAPGLGRAGFKGDARAPAVGRGLGHRVPRVEVDAVDQGRGAQRDAGRPGLAPGQGFAARVQGVLAVAERRLARQRRLGADVGVVQIVVG